MSRILLVRHGQACAFSDEPDRLSPLGWEQAKELGRYWLRHGSRFDAAYHGTLRRQRESYEAVAEACQQGGVSFPQAVVMPGLDEYTAQDLTTVIAPKLARKDPEFAPLWTAWQSNDDEVGRNRRFQLMFEALVRRWVDGRLDEPGLEPWDAFRSRVTSALEEIRANQGRGVQVAVFTSGGPIGVAVQGCLNAPVLAAIEINWRVRNSSVTSFLFSGSRLSLDGFNELPHLAERPELVSFR